MSDTALRTPRAPDAATQVASRAHHRRLGWGAAFIVMAGAPFVLSDYWLQLGFAACVVAISTVGLAVLARAGQITLAQPFFMAAGGLTYVVLVSPRDVPDAIGLGWPPVLALLGGVVVAGALGLLFTAISSRLDGIYLGMASIGLVLLGQHFFHNAETWSGGVNGRRVPDFEVAGITFGRTVDPPVVLGTVFDRAQMQWLLGMLFLVLVTAFVLNVFRARPGRALMAVESGRLTAAVVGVNVEAYKARAFLVASVCAGLSGVLYVQSISILSADAFDLDFALMMLAMVVIGGLGSVGGAIAGTVFVVCLPALLQSLFTTVPALDLGGASTAVLSQYVFGIAIVLVLLFKPTGLVGIFTSITAARLRPNRSATANTTRNEE
ncbi:branched-chain amino acid ABC transporter permease [Pimelobacter simplex]|uniref:branched-chain amino acid ABC transporter permease n=1 Tax=Nocardioides simplex TaxID=2045 RepID=UPI001932CFC4|nr:branched-chain amino acid ABC transporter permease [Pimelobacter simplex]